MKRKKLTAAILVGIILTVNSPVFCSDEMNPVMKLTLDFAAATAEKKDAIEGGKEALKKQYDDWTWNYVIGNYEKLIFQNSEAEIPAFKEKLKKTVEVLEKMDKLVVQLGEGKYDEAAFNTIDAAVGVLDHPAVNAVWAATKMAYESHQLVKQTGAELQIEALYGALDNDRRLRGSSTGDGPKLFNMDAQTVDYFFNKYLITNSGTREMMKAYVRVKLGEEFPEASTITKFSDWIFGTDAAKEEELAELEKFKNTSRRWTMLLLKDLNNQAMVNYNETRTRQELAAFQQFAAKFKYLNLSAEEILKEYKDLQKYKEDSKNFPKYLSESQTKRAYIEQQYAKVSKNSYQELNKLLEAAQPPYSVVCNGKIKAQILNMKSYEDSFNKEIDLWKTLISKISADMSSINSTEAKEEAVSHAGGPSAQSYFNSYFANLIVEYQWKNDFDTKNKEVLDALNSGDFKKAWEIVGKIKSEEMEALGMHFSEKSKTAEDIYKKNMTSLQERYNALLKVETTDKNNLWRQMEELGRAMEALSAAYKVFQEAYGNLQGSQYYKLDESTNLMNSEIYEFQSLAKSRTEELANYRTALKGIYPNLPIRTAWLDGTPLYELRHENSLEYQQIEELYKVFNENRYTSIGKSRTNSPRSYPGELYNQSVEIEQMALSLLQTSDLALNEIPKLLKKWEIGLKDWNALKKPDSDAIAQYIVLVDNNFKYENEFGICEEGVARISTLKGQLNSIKSKMETETDTEYRNRTTDVEFIRTKVIEYNNYIDRLIKQKIIELDITPTGVWISQDRKFTGEYRVSLNADPATGMLVINTPYPHLATKNEIKASPELVKVKAEFKTQPFYVFVMGNAPQIIDYFNKLFSGDFTPYANEDNLLFGTPKPENIVWLSNLTKAELLVRNITVEDGVAYYKKMKELSDTIPKVVKIVSATDLKQQIENEKDPIKKHYLALQKPDDTGTMIAIDENNLASAPMGKRFLDLRTKVADLITKRKEYIQKKRQEESEAYYLQEKINYFKGEIKKIADKVKNIPSNYDENTVNTLYTELYTIKGRYIDQKLNVPEINNLISLTESDIVALLDKLKQQDSQNLQNVKGFYEKFKQAYESQNESQLMNMISDEWDAGDGTTISDLETNLRNMFNVFDSVQYNISNLNIQKSNDNLFNVSYDVEIIGNIYDTGITRDEKSSVYEQVIIDKSGKVKINKTMRGNYWYIK